MKEKNLVTDIITTDDCPRTASWLTNDWPPLFNDCVTGPLCKLNKSNGNSKRVWPHYVYLSKLAWTTTGVRRSNFSDHAWADARVILKILTFFIRFTSLQNWFGRAFSRTNTLFHGCLSFGISSKKLDYIVTKKKKEKNKTEKSFSPKLLEMVFCYQNCADLLWEKIVLVIEKNVWRPRIC